LLQESQLVSVQDAVGCLPAAELKSLAKSLQINCTSLKKHDIANAVVKHSRRQNVSSFFTHSSDATEKMVLKRFVIVEMLLLSLTLLLTKWHFFEILNSWIQKFSHPTGNNSN